VSFKYTYSIQRPGARAQGLGKMMTNTEVSVQDKAENRKDPDTGDTRDGRRGLNWVYPCMMLLHCYYSASYLIALFCPGGVTGPPYADCYPTAPSLLCG